MKLQLIITGKPKLTYAQIGWVEYTQRLQRQHTLRVTQLSDKYAQDSAKYLEAAGAAYKVALVIEQGQQLSSHQLATFLEQQAQQGREVCFMVGGPDGLPTEVIKQADFCWSLSPLTFPHDLAMVILAEALYRASSITAGLPYHH